MEHAARTLDQKALVLRVSQILGPVLANGYWKQHEWLPSLIVSSKDLAVIPNSLGPKKATASQSVNWIPVDIFAEVVVELVSSQMNQDADIGWQPLSHGARVLHITNPRPTQWISLVPSIISAIEEYELELEFDEDRGRVPHPRIVSIDQWVRELLASSRESQYVSDLEGYLEKNPAMRLFEFYRAMADGHVPPALDMRASQAASQVLRDMDGIQPAWMKAWTKSWLSWKMSSKEISR